MVKFDHDLTLLLGDLHRPEFADLITGAALDAQGGVELVGFLFDPGDRPPGDIRRRRRCSRYTAPG